MLKGYLTNGAFSVTGPGHHKIKALVVYTAYKEQKGTTIHTRYKKILKKYEISSKLFLPFEPFYCFELYLLMMVLFQFNPHMHEIFLQRYCMKWVSGDPLKEMIN